MKKLRVVVTGGSGRIGAAVVRRLLQDGYDVVNVDRVEPRKPAGEFKQADLRDSAAITPIFRDCDAVCHLGEYPGRRRLTAEGVFAHNTATGSAVMQTAANVGVERIIYTSTCQVYGAWGEPAVALDQLPIDETYPLRPANAYAASKAANEVYARMLAQSQPSVSIAIFRFPAVMICERGPQMNSSLIDLAKRRETDGYCSYLALPDAADAFACALEAEFDGCEAFHFGAPEIFGHVPITEWMQRYAPQLPALPPDYPPFQGPLNCAKAERVLGWRAEPVFAASRAG